MKSNAVMNKAEMYDFIDSYITEIYDQVENEIDDIVLLEDLLSGRPQKVLEPFCGNGRILIPLARAGHEVCGWDLSQQLLQNLVDRIRLLPSEVQARVSYRRANVLEETWPVGFDVVVLGCNCFYELATPEQQEQCIQSAAMALKSGGFLFLDNDHMEGDLSPSWILPGRQENAFPTGLCADGTQVSGTCETIWYDAPERLVRFRRTATVRTPDGSAFTREWIQQKHPPSTQEMSGWLTKHGFEIISLWGDRYRSPYSKSSSRAVFWAMKR